MSDDEAFIRAIVANPGDDAPRLIYADWLEEREDPRAQLVREEVAVFHGPSRPRFLYSCSLEYWAHEFDPVWVARISRAPLGACSPKVRFLETGTPLLVEDIDALEARGGVKLPIDYRAFLLNWNGGTPDPNHFREFRDGGDEVGDYWELERFFSVPSGQLPTTEPDDFAMAMQELDREEFDFRTLRNGIPIATVAEGRVLILSCGGPNVGNVDLFHKDLDSPELYHLATSFREFLDLLADHDPDWIKFIWTDDSLGFERWLDHGDPDIVYRPTGESALQIAIDQDRWTIVGHLIRRGAEVSSKLRKLIERRGPASFRSIVGRIADKPETAEERF